MKRKIDCCTPSRTGPRTGTAGGTSARKTNPDAFKGHETAVAVVMRSDPKGHMGTDRPLIALDEEAPYRPVKLNFFLICTTAVTNAQFAAFVEATGYRTDAEMLGNSFVFSGFLPDARDTGSARCPTITAFVRSFRPNGYFQEIVLSNCSLVLQS